jgi:hypothetical protein
MRALLISLLVLCVVGAAAGACSSSSSSAQPDGGGDAEPDTGMEAGVHETSAPDTGGGPEGGTRESGMPEAGYEAPHPTAPQISNQGGAVIQDATILPIIFPMHPYATDVAGLASALKQAGYWDLIGEYGVNSVTVGGPVNLTEQAPTTIDDSQIQTWLAGKLIGDAATFGPPSNTTVYTIFYPASTTVGTGCQPYHWTFQDPDDLTLYISYVVVPLCNGGGTNVEDDMIENVTRMWVSALTNPRPLDQVYLFFDLNHVVWEYVTGNEVGTACSGLEGASSVYTPPNVGHPVSKVWSNAAATAGHDPCVPQATGTAYFNSAPVLPDTFDWPWGGAQTTGMTQGVHIPSGQSKTIDIDLFSDAPTSGPWTVSASEVDFGFGTGALKLSFDKTSGKNGDVVHLTIAASPDADAGQTNEVFQVTSTLGATTTTWVGPVAN